MPNNKILTEQEKLDQIYKAKEQDRLMKAKEYSDAISASIPKAFDLPSVENVGLEFGEGSKYDVGITKDGLADREEYRAQNQPALDKWKNSTAKMGTIAATTFLDGTLGTIVGIGNVVSGGEDGKSEFSDFWNNPLSNKLSEWNNAMEEYAPVHTTRAYQEGDLTDKMFGEGASNFWADGVLKNAGFAIGVMGASALTSAGIASLSKNILASAADDLVKAGKYATVEEAASAIANGKHIEEVDKSIKTLAKANKNKSILNTQANITYNSLGEARIEAIGTKNEVFKKLSIEHPEMSEEEKTAYSEKAGNGTFVLNTVLLSATNARQMGNIISSFDGKKAALNSIVKDATTGLYKDASKTGIEVAKKVTGGIVSEGTEEQLQLASAALSEDYYMRVANGEKGNINTLLNAVGEGLSKAYGTQEGWENFVTGAALGTTGIPTVGRLNKKDGTKGMVVPKLSGGAYGEFQEVKESAKNTAEVVDKVNAILGSDSYKSRYNNTVAATSFESDKLKATSKFDYDNAESNQFIIDAATFIDAGLYEDFYEQLKSVSNATEEEVSKLVKNNPTYKGLTSDEVVNKLKTDATVKLDKLKKVRDLKLEIDNAFPNQSAEYKTTLLQYGAILDDVDSRIEQLTKSNKEIFADQSDAIDLLAAVETRMQKILNIDEYKASEFDEVNKEFNTGKITKEEHKEKIDEINSKYDSSIEFGTEALKQLYAEEKPLYQKLSPTVKQKVDKVNTELEKLYKRKSEYGRKYLEAFNIEFIEAVDKEVENAKKKAEKVIKDEAIKANANEVNNKYDDPDKPLAASGYNEDAVGFDGIDDFDLPPAPYETASNGPTSAIVPEAVITQITQDIINNIHLSKSKKKKLTILENNGAEIQQKSKRLPNINISGQQSKSKNNTTAASDTSKVVLDDDYYDDATNSEVEETVKKYEEIQKQEFPSNSIAQSNQAYIEYDRKISATDNDYTDSTSLLMVDPTKLPEGSHIRFVIEDEGFEDKVVYSKQNIATTWGALKATLTEDEFAMYVPTAIYFGNEKLGYVHTEGFINPNRVVAINIPNEKIELAKIRTAIYNDPSITATISERNNGVVKLDFRGKEAPLIERSPNGKIVIIDKGIGKGKVVLAIPAVEGVEHVPLKRKKLKDSASHLDIVSTIKEAILFSLASNNPNSAISDFNPNINKLAKGQYNLNLNKYSDLIKFIKIYTVLFNGKGGNLKKQVKDRTIKQNIDIKYAFDLNINTDKSIDFKVYYEGKYVSVNSAKDLDNREILDAMLKEIESVLGELYINVNGKLHKSNKPLVALTEEGNIFSLGDSYDSFLRNNLLTKLSPVIVGDKEYYRVNPIVRFELNQPDNKGELSESEKRALLIELLNRSAQSNEGDPEFDPQELSKEDSVISNISKLQDLNDDIFARPFEPTDELLEKIEEQFNNVAIVGLRTDLLEDVIDSVVANVGLMFNDGKESITIVEASESIFKTMQESVDNINTALEDPTLLKKSGRTQESLQASKKALELVLNNKNVIYKLADARLKSTTIFEDYEQSETETDIVQYDKVTYSENPSDKVSMEVKKFLSGLPIIENGKVKTNWFGSTSYLDYKTAYEIVQSITLGLKPNLKDIKRALSSKRGEFPWITTLLSKIISASDYVKNRLIKNLTNHENRMYFALYDTKDSYTRYTIAEANSNGIKQILLKNWNSELQVSGAFDTESLDSVTPYFNNLVKIFESFNDNTDINDIVTWLKDFGITTKEDTLIRLSEVYAKDNANILNHPNSPVYNLYRYASKAVSYGTNLTTDNPLNSSPSIIRLAEETAKDTHDITALSFRSGKKTLYAIGTNKHVVNRIRDLKNDPNLIKSLLDLPFNQFSYVLNELKNDPNFGETFNYFTVALEAIKQRDAKERDDADITSISTNEIELYKIANFQALRKKLKSISGNDVSEYANFLFLTQSDKPTVMGMTSKVFPITYDSYGRFTNESKVFLFDGLIRGEIARIQRAFALAKSNKLDEVNRQDFKRSHSLFYLVPELNDEPSIWLDKEAGELDPNVSVAGSPQYNTALNILLSSIKKERADKLAFWKGAGIGDSSDGRNYKWMDIDYMANMVVDPIANETPIQFNNRRLGLAALDMVVQYKLAYANQFQALFTDPANYFKNTKTNVDINDVLATWDNISKRLAGSIAPRMESNHPDKDINYLFIADPESGSRNIEGITKEIGEDKAKPYNEQKESDAQEFITLSEKIGQMMADGEIKSKGLGELIRKTIASEIADWNFYYMDAIDKAVQKLGDEAYVEYQSFVYQPQKPVYFGSVIEASVGLERLLYIKSSAFTLLPNRSGLEDKLRIMAEKSGVHRIVMAKTATKLGAVAKPINPWVKDEQGNIKDIDDSLQKAIVDSATLTVPRDNWGIQLEKPYDAKSKYINRVSQASKNLVNGMLDVEGFEVEGTTMNGSQVRDYYNSLIGQIYINQYDKMLYELDINLNDDGTVNSLNIEKLRRILIEEGLDKGYTLMQLEAIQLDTTLQGLSFSPTAEMIEPLLKSIVESRVLKIKMFGKGLTLGSETLFSGDMTSKSIITTPSWEGFLQPSRVVKENKTSSFAQWKDALKKEC